MIAERSTNRQAGKRDGKRRLSTDDASVLTTMVQQRRRGRGNVDAEMSVGLTA